MMNQLMKNHKEKKKQRSSRKNHLGDTIDDGSSQVSSSGSSGSAVVTVDNNNNNEYYYSSQEIQSRRQQERQHMLQNNYSSSYYNHRESLQSASYSNTSALMYGYTEVHDDPTSGVGGTNPDDIFDDVALNDSTHNELNDIFDHVILSSSTSNRKTVIRDKNTEDDDYDDDDDDDDDIDDLYSDAISTVHNFIEEKSKGKVNGNIPTTNNTNTTNVQRRSVITAAVAEIALSNSFDNYCDGPVEHRIDRNCSGDYDNQTTMTPITSNHDNIDTSCSRSYRSDRSRGSHKSTRSSRTKTNNSSSSSSIDDGRISIEQRRQRLRQYEKQMQGSDDDDRVDDISVNNDQLPTVEQYKTWNGISTTSRSAGQGNNRVKKNNSSSVLDKKNNGKSMLDRFLLRTTAGSRSRQQHKELEQLEQQNLHNVDTVVTAIDNWQRYSQKRFQKDHNGQIGDTKQQQQQQQYNTHDQLPNVDEYKVNIGFRSLTKGIGSTNNNNNNSKKGFFGKGKGNGNNSTGTSTTEFVPSLPLRRSSMGNDSQLPSVEEYKTSVWVSNSNNSSSSWYNNPKNRCRRLLILLIGILLFVIVFVPTYLTLTKRSRDKNSADHNKDIDDADTAMMINDIFAATDESIRVSALIRYITHSGWTDPMSFLEDITGINNTMRSSQYTAAKWLASSLGTYSAELMASPMITSTYLMEQYVLAVFYYSTGGPTVWKDQYNFLPSHNQQLHVCDWNDMYESRGNNVNNSTSTSNSTNNNNDNHQKVGVLCDSNPDTEVMDNDDWYRNSSNFYHISGVTRLYMPSNSIHGTIPSEIRLLTNLRELNLYNNVIGSTIPTHLAELTNLQSLILFDNKLQGTIPSWLSSIPNLRIVNLGKNKDLHGTIPTNINKATALQVLNLEKCSISGDLTSLQGMSSLQALHLASNKISGPLSNTLFDSMTSLIELDVGSNMLTGLPPKTLLSNTKLMVIDIHDNSFYGNISNDLDDVSPSSNVRVISLRHNNFTGPLAPWIYKFNTDFVQHVGVSDNMFTGTIPSEIGTMTNLKFLYIAKNKQLTPSRIPTEFGKLTKLQDLSLQSSNVIGTIPTELAQLKQLVLFDLNNNSITGYIPFQFGSGMKSLRFMLLSHNKLSGIIPETFEQLVLLDSLLLNNNTKLTGTTNTICKPKLPRLRVFKADCMQFISGCPCCSTCCDESVDDNDMIDKTNKFVRSSAIAAASLNYNLNEKRRNYCDATVFFPELDPSGEYSYVRKFYKSRESDIIFPVADTPDHELPLYDGNNNSIFGGNATIGVLPSNADHQEQLRNNPFNFGPLEVLINRTIPSSDSAYGPYGNNDAPDDKQDGNTGEPGVSNTSNDDDIDNSNNDYDDDTADYDDDYSDDGNTDDRSRKDDDYSTVDEVNAGRDEANGGSNATSTDVDNNQDIKPDFAEVIDVYETNSESSGP